MHPALLVVGMVVATTAPLEIIELPGGAGGIGFDDLRFSPELRRVLVPAGRTGRLDLVDPRTRAVEEVGGFSASTPGDRGHSEGTTSADSGKGLVFASDRTRRTLAVVDPQAKRIVAEIRLGGGPDYVRWVEPLREVWVTEPDEKQIETFRFENGTRRSLTRTGSIRLDDGPESLEVDARRGRAYANTWHDLTVAVDLRTRAVVSRWKNGCRGARGLALDPRRGRVLVGCAEGAAVALDVDHGGKVVGRASTGAGVDVIAFSPERSHLYVPAADAAILTVLAVREDGVLRVLGTAATAPGAHCVAADDAGHAYVCDPRNGRLLVFTDPY